MQQIDADIISRCKAGDKAAFRTVVQNCQGMVYSLSLKMLADVEEAKDVVQDTFIKVWQNLASYDDRYSFDERVFEQVADDSDPERQLESSEWVSVIRVMADGLSGKQKLVFTLSQLEGLDTAQITEITGLDADQIKSNLYAAKKNIRERLIKMGYGKD